MTRRTTVVWAAILLMPTIAVAQSGRGTGGTGRNTMVMDDGSGPRVLSFSRPNVGLALQPDYIKADLAVMTEILSLSTAQEATAGALLEQYLVALDALVQEHFSDLHDQAPRRAGGEGGPGRERNQQRNAGGGGGRRAGGPGSPNPEMQAAIRDVILDELRQSGFDVNTWDDLPYPPEVSVGVDIEQGEEGPPQPTVNVGVSFGAGDDSLTDDVRDQLEQAAERITPRIRQLVEAQVLDQIRSAPPAAMGGGDPIEARWSEIEHTRARIQELLARKKQLRETFESDVQAILEQPQLDRWDALQRQLTREKTLPWGTLDGEQTNLLAIVDRLDLAVQDLQAVEPLLEEYEVRLHDVLTRRNDVAAAAAAEIDRALYEGKTRRALSIVDRERTARVNVRELNRLYASRIVETLNESGRRLFESAYLADAYPRVYRETTADRAFGQARQIGSLSAETRREIAELYDAYRLQLQQANESVRVAIDRHEPDRERAEIESVISIMEQEPPEPGNRPEAHVSEAFARRVELDASFMRRLYALLDETQRTGLPPIPGDEAVRPVRSQSGGG